MSRTVKAIPHGYHSLTPYLIFRDAAKAIEFYGRAFGAVETCRMNDPQTGKVLVVALYITDKELQASADTVAAWKQELIPQAGGKVVSVDEYEVIAGDPGQG